MIERKISIPIGQSKKEESGEVVDGISKRASKYEDRAVAFIDILGFKNIIERSRKNPDYIGRIFEALTINTSQIKLDFIAEMGFDEKVKTDNFSERINSFSDCIVISVNNQTIEEIGLLIYTTFKVARLLISYGFASRGGIAAGELLHQKSQNLINSVVFGPAFVRAYTLEETHAGGPRIILQKQVWDRIKEYRDTKDDKLSVFFKTHVQRASDGPAFINIFADFKLKQDISSEVMAIRGYIQDMLDQSLDAPKIFKKNAHLAKLFNKAVSETKYKNQRIDSDILPG